MKGTIDAVKCMRRMTMTVRFQVSREKELALRVWIGCKLIQLAARVMNCGLEFKTVAASPPEGERGDQGLQKQFLDTLVVLRFISPAMAAKIAREHGFTLDRPEAGGRC